MYFLSLFCQISKEIEAILRSKLVLYTHINFTNRTAKKLSPVITNSRLWLNNLLPKSAFPAAGEGLQHPPAPPAQPSSLCQRGGGRSNVATTDVSTAVPVFCRSSCAHIPSATALGQSSYLTCTAWHFVSKWVKCCSTRCLDFSVWLFEISVWFPHGQSLPCVVPGNRWTFLTHIWGALWK